MPGTHLIWITADDPLPPTRLALGPDSGAPGLLAAGGQIALQRLEEAYRLGVFPWYNPGDPPLWWSPDPRMVLPVAEFHLSATMRKTLRRFIRDPRGEIRIDSAFARVIRACAETPRDGRVGTWIVDEIAEAYTDWHRAGRVHSIETWIDGELVGGLYCVGIGRMVFGESMFSQRSDASKIALAALVAFCRAHGIALIDCQQHTRHLASFGARQITRRSFEAHLSHTLGALPPPAWAYHPRLWAQLDLGAAAPEPR
ncbi:MAG: leucyl/phenylalanyl-tRNA--protein transferase [Burkholderiaceae bacterium]|nr:leucyl/phenylalanyl-tRNA--protein transferase [Burkholderiaceae bacterium]